MHKLSTAQEKAGVVGMFMISAMRNGKVVRTTGWQKNRVVNNTDVGVQLLIQQMAGITTNPIAIDTIRIGTGSTPRTVLMTDLVAPVTAHIPFTDRVAVGNEWAGDFFILDSEIADGTYHEVGVYMSLKLYATALISGGFTKVTGEDLLVSYKTTITPV